MVNIGEKRIFPTSGVKKSQGSVIANSFMKVPIVIADFEGVAAFVEDRSSFGFSQQLKPPPKIRKSDYPIWEHIHLLTELGCRIIYLLGPNIYHLCLRALLNM